MPWDANCGGTQFEGSIAQAKIEGSAWLLWIAAMAGGGSAAEARGAAKAGVGAKAGVAAEARRAAEARGAAAELQEVADDLAVCASMLGHQINLHEHEEVAVTTATLGSAR